MKNNFIAGTQHIWIKLWTTIIINDQLYVIKYIIIIVCYIIILKKLNLFLVNFFLHFYKKISNFSKTFFYLDIWS